MESYICSKSIGAIGERKVSLGKQGDKKLEKRVYVFKKIPEVNTANNKLRS